MPQHDHGYLLLWGRVQAALFDLDGTLADTEELLLETWAELLGEYGHAYTAEDYLEIVGTPEDEKVPELLARYGIPEDPKGFYARFMERLKARLRTDLKARPGAEDALKRHRSRSVPMGLVTSATEWHAEHALETLGLKQYFYPGARITADTPGLVNRKPHPEPYLLAAKRMHVRPSGCLAYEDSVQGATAAKAAGMIVVGVTHRLTDRAGLEAVADHVIPEGKTLADFDLRDIKGIEYRLPQRPR